MRDKLLALVDEIERVRTHNNALWMHILRIAIQYNPEETKSVLSRINNNDKKISDLVKKISETK